MIIDAGQFRTKLTLQTLAISQDATGGTVETWTDGPTVWAKVSPLSSREAYWAAQVHATTTHTVTMRYTAAVTPQSRLKIAGTSRVMNVDGVSDVDERHQYLIISATEEIGEV